MLKKLQIYLVLLSLCLLPGIGQSQRKLTTPNPSPEAAAVYCYLLQTFGKKTLSAQQWSGGFNELNYIQQTTGKQPVIVGLDFINESTNPGYVRQATDWWKKGGIPTIMYHMGAPSKGEGYESSKKSIDINRVFQSGTAENKDFFFELKRKADYLQQLRDAHIPILWRPFHELNGGWFWWSKQGPELYKKLWIAMYNYFVNERKLNNLIWVLCYSGDPNGSWFPGNQYVDIAGADTYGNQPDPQTKMYNNAKNSIGGNYTIPLVYHECGYIPDPDQCKAQNSMWLWWMEWNDGYLRGIDKNYLKKVYNHDLVVTMDEVPNIMKLCAPNPTAVEDEQASEDITTCYPNPFSGEFNISSKGDYNYTIYNTDGKEMEKGVGQNTVVAGKSLQPGFYIVKIQSPFVNKNFKITKD